MSLWIKPIHEITFQDVDEFCKAGWEESTRLDYKGDQPDDIAKTMAAIANTVGGMIVLGVDADKKTNKPIWPPAPLHPSRAGLPFDVGLSEKLYQHARFNIFPPLTIEVSPIIENAHAPGQAIAVIRIPESKDAPHAVEKKTVVYIYDRNGNTNDPHKLADIDYIERLFERREREEVRREKIVTAAIQRGVHRISQPAYPLRWASVIPFYPWRKLATPNDCFQFQLQRWDKLGIAQYATQWTQRMPGGSFCTFVDQPRDQKQLIIGASSVTEEGHFFGMNFNVEHPQPESKVLDWKTSGQLLFSVLKAAKNFFESPQTSPPGFLRVSFGVENARDALMGKYEGSFFRGGKTRFLDESYRVDRSLLTIDDPEKLALSFMEEIAFAFNIPGRDDF